MKRNLIVIFLLLAVSVSLYGQNEKQRFLKPTLQNNLLEKEGAKYQSSIERFYKNRTILLTTNPQILEDTLAAKKYIVGPGDQFQIHIFGQIEDEFQLEVLPEGQLVIPTVGTVKVGNLNLWQVRQKIMQAVQSNYIRSSVTVSLLAMRKFRVYITGEIIKPGTYFVQASDRLLDIIEIAGNLSDWADETSISIRHQNGKVDTVDISRFIRWGDKAANPTLHAGDLINVPSLKLNQPHVFVDSYGFKLLQNKSLSQRISGGVITKKIYRLFPEETLSNFLNRIGGLSASFDLANISLVRAGKKQHIDLMGQSTLPSTLKLKSGDEIVIPVRYDVVYVRGDVRAPGAYPFNAQLTAADYVGKAGALEIAKDSESIMIVRTKTGEVLHGGDIIVQKGDMIVVPRKTREILRTYIGIVIPVVSIILSTYSILTRP